MPKTPTTGNKMARDVRERAIWRRVIRDVNAGIAKLQCKPKRLRRGYQVSPAGILNAYREGDLSFDEAVSAIQGLINKGSKR